MNIPKVPLLPLVLGVTDGILNALTLSASAILDGAPGQLTSSLALRVGVAALVTAAFTMFVADYADRRAHLVRASKQLNLTGRGRLAETRLGKLAMRDSAIAMVVAAASSFAGATAPLIIGVLVPSASWLVLIITIAGLAVLGWLLGRLVAGRPIMWAAGMFLGGIVVTLIGLELHLT